MKSLSTTESFIVEWHAAATNNRFCLTRSGGGTCGSCKTKLDIKEIEWMVGEDTGQCPECGIDCIIPESVLVGTSPEMLEKFRLYWFGRAE